VTNKESNYFKHHLSNVQSERIGEGRVSLCQRGGELYVRAIVIC
jgi:hypothetical protein